MNVQISNADLIQLNKAKIRDADGCIRLCKNLIVGSKNVQGEMWQDFQEEYEGKRDGLEIAEWMVEWMMRQIEADGTEREKRLREVE